MWLHISHLTSSLLHVQLNRMKTYYWILSRKELYYLFVQTSHGCECEYAALHATPTIRANALLLTALTVVIFLLPFMLPQQQSNHIYLILNVFKWKNLASSLSPISSLSMYTYLHSEFKAFYFSFPLHTQCIYE